MRDGGEEFPPQAASAEWPHSVQMLLPWAGKCARLCWGLWTGVCLYAGCVCLFTLQEGVCVCVCVCVCVWSLIERQEEQRWWWECFKTTLNVRTNSECFFFHSHSIIFSWCGISPESLDLMTGKCFTNKEFVVSLYCTAFFFFFFTLLA